MGCSQHLRSLLASQSNGMATRNKLLLALGGRKYSTACGCPQALEVCDGVECNMYLDDVTIMSRSHEKLILATTVILDRLRF
eukprot:2592881-Amphidinium_carterae.1